MPVSLTPISKGLQFARYTAALANARGDYIDAAGFARRQWRDTPIVAECLVRMAAVAGGSPYEAGWASELIATGLAQDFTEAVRARTVIDRLTGVHHAPFFTNVPVETGSTGGAWIGSGLPIPVITSTFSTVAIANHHAAVIVVLLGELIKLMTPAAIASIRDSLVAGVVQFLDQQFLDPSVTAIGTASPGSITSGGVEVITTGNTAAAITQDLSNMVDATDDLISPVWVMRAKTCVHLAGTLQLPGIKIVNGDLFGIPIITTKSQATPPGSPELARHLTLIDQDAVLIGDEGAAHVDITDSTSLQMDDAPGSGAQAMVSLFQTGGAAARVSRQISWKRTRNNGAVFMEVGY